MLKRIPGDATSNASSDLAAQAPATSSDEAPKTSVQAVPAVPPNSDASGTRQLINAGSAMRQALQLQLPAANPDEKPVPLAVPGATFGTVAVAAAETYGTKFPDDSSFIKIASIGNMTPLDHEMTKLTGLMQGVIDKNNRPSFNIAVPTKESAAPADEKNSMPAMHLDVHPVNLVMAEIEGLHAIARYDPASKELILAYRGTVPVNPANLVEDAKLAVLHPPKHLLGTALLFAQQTMDQLKAQGKPVQTVICTGHSLGGYIAESVAANLPHDESTKVIELALDAPGLPPKEWAKTLDLQATNVSAEGDVVHLAGGLPVGRPITFGEAPSGPTVLQPLVQHMLSQILKPLSEQPALANLHIAKLNGQSKEALAALSSISVDDYKNMPLEQRRALAEGNLENLATAVSKKEQEPQEQRLKGRL